MKLRQGSPEEVGMSAQRIRHIANLAEGWVAQGIHPALVILVARKGVVVLHEAFGRLTPEPDAPPLQLDTIFPLMSLTKPITSTAALLLVEDGLLGLNRPVSEYIPEFVGEGKDAVMVHHLLTHTSGLRDEDVYALAEKQRSAVVIPPPDETQDPRINEYLFLGYDAPLRKPPGMEMSYSDYGYNLLGEILRRVSGRSLAIFAHERIFGPLSMRDTSYRVPGSLRHRIVRRPADAPRAGPEWPGYDDLPSIVRSLTMWAELNSYESSETPWADSGAYSTAMDLAVFGQMFLNQGSYGGARILSPATVAEMTRNQIPGISASFGDEYFPEASWGLGWNILGRKKALYGSTLHSPRAFIHGGAGGVRQWVDPVHEIVGVYFSVVVDPHGLRHCADLFINAVTAAVMEV